MWIGAMQGTNMEDAREIIELRKTMEEITTRKRAVYRRRFEMLDEMDASVKAHIKEATE